MSAEFEPSVYRRRPISETSSILKGTVRGKTIELERAPGLPDGQTVSVTLVATSPTGDGLGRSFGSWADDASELEPFLRGIREDRKRQRDEIAP
jgi:hypothetical protein